ncbi:MAG: EamA family transporter [Pseudomonadota bacterium]
MPVDAVSLAALLFAGFLHASWNAFVKGADDPLVSIACLNIGMGALAVVLFILAPLPEMAAWPWLLAGILLHTLYNIALAMAYSHGDYVQIYPLARGLAPMQIALVSMVLLPDESNGTILAGITILSLGVLALGIWGNNSTRSFNVRGIFWAVLTGSCIAGYTIIDGIGVRLAGTSAGFLAILSFSQMILINIWCFTQKGQAIIALPLHLKLRYMVGGVMSGLAFLLVLWAIYQGVPIAVAAALRETSMVFALGFSLYLLHERLSMVRIVSVLAICLGVMVVKLG